MKPLRQLCILSSLLCIPFSLFANITPLTALDCKRLKSSNSLHSNNPVPCNRLSNVSFKFVDFSGNTQHGTVTVLDVIAIETQAVFDELFMQKFPLAQATPIQHFDGDDKLSMEANNTSAFNGRNIIGEKEWSKHAYGVAIDINPIQNPYVSYETSGVVNVMPFQSGNNYLNRLQQRPEKKIRMGMIEDVIDIFYAHGFLRWGGEWDNPIDYQHIEIGSYNFIQYLLSMPLIEAQSEFQQYGERYRHCLQKSSSLAYDIHRKNCIQQVRR